MDVGVFEREGKPAGLTTAARVVARRFLTEDQLSQPEGKTLFSHAGGPVKEQGGRKGVIPVSAGQIGSGILVTPESVKAHLGLAPTPDQPLTAVR